MQIRKLTCALLILSTFGCAAQARTKTVADTSGALKTLTSIGDALDSPDHHPVHILYLHGINVVGAGGSGLLRQSICTKLNLCAVSDWKNAGTEYPDKGQFAPGAQPPALTYLGNPIWNNSDEWRASAPFVVHWVVHLRGHAAALVVDEINWWPLDLALKCRHFVAIEPYLAGPNRNLLQVCSEQAKQDPDGLGRFYPWITPDQAKRLAAIRPRAVLINRSLKVGLMDWGLSDVMLVVGPISGILRDGLRQLMAKSAAFDPNETSAAVTDASERYDWRSQVRRDNTMDQEFIAVTHSLGGYLLFNTLITPPVAAGTAASDAARHTDENSAMRYIFERTSLVYFLANQLAMLEITNMDTGPSLATGAAQTPETANEPAAAAEATNFRALVNRWAQMQSSFQTALHPNDASAREKIQVVAWSDPSDVLTWRAPKIGDVDVVNLDVQNAPHWFWLFESPASAHTTYAENKNVLKVMFQNTSQPGTH